MIYLDSAATTLQKPPSVAIAMQRAVNTLASPGRGGHFAAMHAAETAYKAREAISELFRLNDPEAVVFTMNATHALNIAIRSLVEKGDKAVVSAYEHNSAVRPLYAAGAEVTVAYSELFDSEGCVAAFDQALVKGTKLAVVNHCSNVFGFIQPISRIAEICAERNIALVIDASQSAGVIDIDFTALGASFIAMPGHKGLYGPQGTGVLLCGKIAEPLIYGGSGGNSRLRGMPDFLPDRLEAGTHNMPGIAGLYEGVRFVKQKGVSNIFKHEKELLRSVIKGLSGLKGVKLYLAEEQGCQSAVLSFTIQDKDSETVAEQLSRQGIATRAGLHCAPLAHEHAGTLEGGTVRLSFSVFNTQREIQQTVNVLRRIV